MVQNLMTNSSYSEHGHQYTLSAEPEVKKTKKMRFGGLPGLKSTQKKFSAPKKNPILGEKKFRFFENRR